VSRSGNEHVRIRDERYNAAEVATAPNNAGKEEANMKADLAKLKADQQKADADRKAY
jgi:hypothetical protein